MTAPPRTTPENGASTDLQRRELRLQGLLLAGMAGDTHAYREFLKALSAHLRAYLRPKLRALPDEVEDLVQETLLAVHNQRHTYRSDLPLTAWVQAIARYRLIDFLRARRHREALHDTLEDDLPLFARDDHAASAAHRDVHTLLNHLPDHQRLPLLHTKLHGLSVAETAQATGLSESAVKVGVHRGLKALAARLKRTS